MPADVRKAFGPPASLSSRFWATPNCWGGAQNSLWTGTEAQSASAHQAAEPQAWISL